MNQYTLVRFACQVPRRSARIRIRPDEIVVAKTTLEVHLFAVLAIAVEDHSPLTAVTACLLMLPWIRGAYVPHS